MLSCFVSTIFLCFVTHPSVAVPFLPQVNDSLLAAPSASSKLPTLSNISTSATNASSSSSNILKISCDPAIFGRNLKVKSCRDLFGYLRPDEDQFAFAERDSGIPYDVPLPARTYSNDGVCYLQPALDQGAMVGHASPKQVVQAGAQVLQTCVIERGMGGWARMIGGDNHVQVAMGKYEPKIKCDSSGNPAPSWVPCVGLFSNMRAGDRLRIFGTTDQPGIEEGLPYILEAEHDKCELGINIVGHTSTVASWYELWAATTALASVCVRWKSKGGVISGLGAHRNIYLELAEKVDFPTSATRLRISNVTSVQGAAGIRALSGPGSMNRLGLTIA